jgi:glycosyltransferase involved in cell wall biosynthesis
VFGPAQRALLAGMGVPAAAIRVVPNGVDVERYRPGPSEWGERLRARRLFVYLGRLDREKNVEALVDSFLEAGPPADARLALAGDGTERARLARRAHDPRVALLGPLPREADRIGLLRAADALFLPSAIEGLSLALLEGMACGACPVATDVGCDGDAVRGAGILLDPVDLRGQLRLAVRLLTTSPQIAADLGRLARARAVERYSLARNVDALLGIYAELVTRGARTVPAG